MTDDPVIPSVEAPSSEHGTGREAMERMLRAYQAASAAGREGWVTFQVGGDDGPCVQVLDDVINLCLVPLDLPALLGAKNEEELAARLEPEVGGPLGTRVDRTMWRLLGPNPEDLARVIDIALQDGLEVGAAYTLRGAFEEDGSAEPGPLGQPLSSQGPAGWLLLLVSCGVIVAVAAAVVPLLLHVFAVEARSAWSLLLVVILGGAIAVGAGALVHRLGRP